MFKTAKSDVLIIGAGGAGLRAAIESYNLGAKVILISKSLIGKAHTVMAEGGVAAALRNADPKDDWRVHFRDTMVEGQMISDWRMVEILVKEIPDRIKELEEWGAVFDRTEDGKIAQRLFGAHTYKRACYIGDRVGLEILHTCQEQILSMGIEILDEVIVTKILKNGKNVAGAICVDLKSNELILIKTKVIILATGGAGRLYKVTTNSWETTGQGYALALDAGAELQDMEMIQFHPTGMVWPESIAGMLVTEAVRAEGGILLNVKNERFMKNYDPKRMELGPRDFVARAIYHEIKAGRGTKHGGIWLDISHKGRDYVLKRLPRMHDQFETYAGVDITKERMEVAPTAHYVMGGIKVGIDCRTSVPGLFAAGEAAAGVHGANRLGGNSLADILVFGKRAGIYAANYASKISYCAIDKKLIDIQIKKIELPFKTNGENPSKIKEKIQELMWKYVGIARTEKGLNMALSALKRIKSIQLHAESPFKYNHSWIEAIQIPGMLTVCEAIIKSAILRKESRGAHFREDFPRSDDKNWLGNIVCRNFNGQIKLDKIDVQKLPPEMERLLI